MRRLVISSVVGLFVLGLLALAPTSAHAQRFGFSIGPGYGAGGYGAHGGYGGYYGNGGHDFVPHWHNTYTPFGAYSWYGLGAHDFRPHQHSYSPYSYRGYSNTPLGPTQSIYPRYPYYYAPW